MIELSSISPNQLIVLSLIVAVLLTDDLDSDEIGVIGNFISIVGSLMQTIASQEHFIETKQQEVKQKEIAQQDISQQDKILEEINALKQKFNELERKYNGSNLF